MKKRVTRKDIAQMTGCSVSVVSRALNNSGYVEKEKKKLILNTAKQLGYLSNPVARVFKENLTKQLLFLGGNLTGAYFNQLYHGMAQAAEERGYRVLALVSSSNFDTGNFDIVKDSLSDGILFAMESFAIQYLEAFGKNYFLPAVTISFLPTHTFARSIPALVVDHDSIVNTGIDYLIKNGHKKIGIAIPFYSGYPKSRYIAWKARMMREIGEECLDYVINVHGTLTAGRTEFDIYRTMDEGFCSYDAFSSGISAGNAFTELKNKPTAMICFNDDMAFGMMMQLKKLGVNIPDDISVLGIDGVYTRRHFDPLLTSVSVYPDQQGKECANVLIDMIEDKKVKFINYTKYGILEGSSVKKREAYADDIRL